MEENPRRVGLIGCVKTKRPVPTVAQDLYTSPLFKGQRAFVERTCLQWFILSAQHGLVDPETVLAPYEKTLNGAPRSERRAWAKRVLDQIDARLGDLSSTIFETHAGAAYLDFGLLAGLQARGARIENPVEGLSMGRRLSFYKAAGCL